MKLRVFSLLAILAVMSGCASNTLKKEAFAKPRKLAVVTVMGSVHGLATNDEDDKQLLKNLVDVSFKELNKSSHIKLVSQSSVLSSKAYKAIKDDGPIMSADMPAGYKRFDVKAESANLKALAKELHVDGFVFITAGYGTNKSGMSIGLWGIPIPLSAGSTKAHVSYTVAAVDPNGDSFWQEAIQRDSDEGVTTVMGLGDVQSLQPKLIDMTQAACREAVTHLDDQLAGR